VIKSRLGRVLFDARGYTKAKIMDTSQSIRLLSSPDGTRRSKSIALIFALLAVGALLAHGVRAQSGRGQRERSGDGSGVDLASRGPLRGNSSLTGRVIYDGTEAPAKGARVRISLRDAGGLTRATVTNEHGEFRFDNLPAGEYSVAATPADAPMVSAQTFALPLPSGDPEKDEAALAAARMGSETAASSSFAQVLVNGQQDVRIEMRVTRPMGGGQVTGRVLYEDGKPAANAQLTFLSRTEPVGRRIGPSKLTVMTDEHGLYRAAGLPPGDYILSARLQEKRYIDKQGRIYGGLLILTYYPSVTNARSATPIHISADQELSDINITLVKRSTYNLSGTVLSSRSERALAGVRVRLRHSEDVDLPFSTGTDDRFTVTDAEGRFSFDQVMDGDYVISVGGENSVRTLRPMIMEGAGGARAAQLPPRLSDMAQRPERPGGDATQMLVEKQQAVTVAGSDVKGLAIRLSEGGRVSGTVTIEGEGQIPQRLIITSEMRPGERRPSAFVRPDAEGNFNISGVPEGPLSLNVIISPPQRLYVKSITANGVDIQREPLIISDGTEVSGVQIVLSSNVATLTGRVLSEDGTPRQGATVLLVPATRSGGPTVRSRLIAVTRSDGRFIIVAGPGEYQAVVWTGRPPSNEEALRALAERAPRLSLQEGERKDLDLVAPAAQ
jgi:Carboxypeptidase regulatory-like domain